MSTLILATWKLCLGLLNKKDLVTGSLSRNGISACCIRETDIPMNFPENVLDFNNYVLELELNSLKKRSGIYIRKDIKYLTHLIAFYLGHQEEV